MLKKLRLKNFKNFKDAELTLGPFTVLIGANASGKSNIRDAFRFLHGIGRGYTLADIIGEKRGEGWTGIRGGPRAIAFYGSSKFALDVDFDLEVGSTASYKIAVDVSEEAKALRVVAESLRVDKTVRFESPSTYSPLKAGAQETTIMVLPGTPQEHEKIVSSKWPALSLLPRLLWDEEAHPGGIDEVAKKASEARIALSRMRFLDFDPEVMRQPSLPEQPLGDRGENLSSALHKICSDEKRRAILLEWVEELTPMDCTDLEFPEDQIGRVLVTLVEKNGQKTSAYSASDGTLRFLGLLAALFEPDAENAESNLNVPHCYFIEELENGIHPTRLALLLNLIEQWTAHGHIQVIATTHSPLLLGLLREESLKHASLVYRLPDSPDGRIKRILDVPDAKRLIKKQRLTDLHASGWFEDVMYFTEDSESES